MRFNKETDPELISSRGLLFRTLTLVWVLWLSFDFFVHGWLFAPIYKVPLGFLLPPEQLFTRIPLAYVGFLCAQFSLSGR